MVERPHSKNDQQLQPSQSVTTSKLQPRVLHVVPSKQDFHPFHTWPWVAVKIQKISALMALLQQLENIPWIGAGNLLGGLMVGY